MLGCKNFFFDKATKTFVTDASDLGPQGIETMLRNRGFQMKSERTGEIRDFKYVRTAKDEEGDVQFWQFNDTRGEFVARVYND